MAAAATSPSNPFIKDLASSDRRIREHALSSLRTFLRREVTFQPLDLLKLWKGLFYCMWMSDKPRNQQQLARDLADLIDALAPANFLGFVSAFWTTMAGEWNGIDRLRLDKYLYLVRCYVNKGFDYVGRREWEDEELLEGYLDVLEAVPLNARDGKIPNGVRYHVIDVYVDELDKVDSSRTAPIDKVLRPMRKLGTESLNKSIKSKVREAVEDERLVDWSHALDGDGETSHEATSTTHNQEQAEVEVEGDGEDNFGGFGD